MNRFIVLEGLDGAGKSTQLRLLADYLREKGEDVYVDVEPTTKETGKLIRRVLSGELPSSPWATAALFLADRVNQCAAPETGLRARLARGQTVLLDRYYYSTFAYQGYETDLDWTVDIHYRCPELLRPDLVLFLTMPVKKCMERILEHRGTATEIYETEERLQKVSDQFDEVFARLMDRENVVYIDADGTVDEVFARIAAAVEGDLR